jgi:hypothetical protein
MISRDHPGIAGDGGEAGVRGEFRGAAVLGHVLGVDEEFGGQDLAHAGQALHDVCEWVLGEVFGDRLVDGVDAL